MINRQAMRGAGTKTTTKTPARTKLTKGAGARATIKAKGKATAAGPAKRPAKAPSAATTARAGRRTRDGRDGAAGRPVWRGEEVFSPSPLVASSAEEAAARAEGNSPVPAELVARDPDHGTFIEKGPARRPRADDPDVAENAEEKRQSAVEEHADRSSRHYPFGRL